MSESTPPQDPGSHPAEPVPGMPPGMLPGMPPIPPGVLGPPGGPPPPADGDPPPIETFTQYDQERDVFHCSYGPVQPARTVWDEDREIQVRLDMHSRRVVGFSIPEFAKWLEAHGTEDGGFEMDLPEQWEGALEN